MTQFTVVYDACVMYPAALRDFLMHLAITNLFRARWTDRIHEEWIRNVLRDRPDLTARQLARTRQLMDENILDCLVTGYESLIPTLSLPDPNDRHVLAAAIRCGANSIVTFNTKDFPKKSLEPFLVLKHSILTNSCCPKCVMLQVSFAQPLSDKELVFAIHQRMLTSI